MAEKKPLYQPWNEEEFNGDIRVSRGMNWLQRHFYRTLLQAAFFCSTRPYLPDDDNELWILADAESKQMWLENKASILTRFYSVDVGGFVRLANKRVLEDWNRLLDKREELAERGRSGGLAKAKLVLTSSLAPACQDIDKEKRSEEKVKESEGNQVSSQEVRKPQGGDWKTLRIRHKRIFGSQAAIVHQEKYDDACRKYGEDVVLECFEDWALESKDWVETNHIKQPLFAFWKKVSELAETVIAVKSEEQAEAEVAAATEQERAKQAVETTAAIEEQIRRNIEHMNAVPDLGNMCEDLPELPEETE